jgi:hypothetical protein
VADQPTRQLARGRAVVLPLNIVVNPNELPLPFGRAVMMNPVLSQLTDALQVALIRWGAVRVTVTIQLFVPETLMVVL